MIIIDYTYVPVSHYFRWELFYCWPSFLMIMFHTVPQNSKPSRAEAYLYPFMMTHDWVFSANGSFLWHLNLIQYSSHIDASHRSKFKSWTLHYNWCLEQTWLEKKNTKKQLKLLEERKGNSKTIPEAPRDTAVGIMWLVQQSSFLHFLRFLCFIYSQWKKCQSRPKTFFLAPSFAPLLSPYHSVRWIGRFISKC